MIPLVYIAGPFRGLTPYEVHRNVCAAEHVGFEVAKRGGFPIIPHTMTQHFDKLLTDDFWIEGHLRMLRCCNALVMIPGWARSQGAIAKRDSADGKIPIFYWEYDHDRDSFGSWVRVWIQNQKQNQEPV